jgi:hypothetical protein
LDEEEEAEDEENEDEAEMVSVDEVADEFGLLVVSVMVVPVFIDEGDVTLACADVVGLSWLSWALAVVVGLSVEVVILCTAAVDVATELALAVVGLTL